MIDDLHRYRMWRDHTGVADKWRQDNRERLDLEVEERGEEGPPHTYAVIDNSHRFGFVLVYSEYGNDFWKLFDIHTRFEDSRVGAPDDAVIYFNHEKRVWVRTWNP